MDVGYPFSDKATFIDGCVLHQRRNLMGFCDIDFSYSIILVSGSKYVCVCVCMCVVVPSILGHGWDLGNKMPRGESERERERASKMDPNGGNTPGFSGILMGK